LGGILKKKRKKRILELWQQCVVRQISGISTREMTNRT